MNYYLDTSAIVRMVVEGPESAALLKWLSSHRPRLVASDLIRTEGLKAARRVSPEAVARMREAISTVYTLRVTTEICARAAELDPSITHSLDALHLASALSLGDGLEGVVTYDERLADACRSYGFRVLAPADPFA